MDRPKTDPRDERVLILTPTGRDAELASAVLARAGVVGEVCVAVPDLCRAIAEGAGAALIAKEALHEPLLHELAETLGRQPPWSDFPLIVLTGNSPGASDGIRQLESVRPLGNVTLVERPVRVATLVSSLRAALAARRRQYQVRDLLLQLNDAIRRRDEFLAMLGHELRNPLAAIRNAVVLLDFQPGAERAVAESREIIERQARHLSRLVDDLLDVSRVTSGKITLQLQPLDLCEIARRCVRTMEGAGRAQRHHISVDVTCGPAMVRGDLVRLEQIVTNLLANAIKYTPADGKITVHVSRRDDSVELRMVDDGVGIESGMLDQIFEPFAQIPGSLERSEGGFGIGLALVRSLVTLHGGTVEARSDGLWRGSEFLVRLPAYREAVSPAASRPQQVQLPPAPTPTARRILVVEDHPDNRRTLGILLSAWGHHVETAEDGPAGVAAAVGSEFHLALVDIGLPGLDGYQVAQKIREAIGDRIFLIALTGYGQPEDRRRALDAGFDAHLVKPVDLEALAEMIAGASKRAEAEAPPLSGSAAIH